jgi:hypothetical protein
MCVRVCVCVCVGVRLCVCVCAVWGCGRRRVFYIYKVPLGKGNFQGMKTSLYQARSADGNELEKLL